MTYCKRKDRQTVGKHTNRVTARYNIQADRWADRQSSRTTDRQTGRGKTYRLTGLQVKRAADGKERHKEDKKTKRQM